MSVSFDRNEGNEITSIRLSAENSIQLIMYILTSTYITIKSHSA
jgi:hypothetical protein